MDTKEFYVELSKRSDIVEDRKMLDNIIYSNSLPTYMIEKIDELKTMIRLGLDNFSIKMLILFLEEVMIHILVADEIETVENYITTLSDLDLQYKYGWQVLNELNNRNLINDENYKFCSKYFHDERRGGSRLRNIEIHNLIPDKISEFELRDEVKEKMNESTIDILTKTIKTNPSFIHIGARDLVSRSILNEYQSIIKLLNDSSTLLNKLNHLTDEKTEEITKGLPTSQSFQVAIKHNSIDFELIADDIGRIDSFQRVEREKIDKNNDRYVVYLNKIISSMDFMIMINSMKSLDYGIGEVGIFHN